MADLQDGNKPITISLCRMALDPEERRNCLRSNLVLLKRLLNLLQVSQQSDCTRSIDNVRYQLTITFYLTPLTLVSPL
jgi:hypothetical protein